MGLCKCPKRKVTNLFCFEHRVNVCEHCLVSNHYKCIVQSYLQWLQDSDYNPNCSLCQTPLVDGDTLRLICYDVFHWSCFNEYFNRLPKNTAPAGYLCPSCNTCIYPPSNMESPICDNLRTMLKTVNWARAGLGLPLIDEVSSATTTTSSSSTDVDSNGLNLYPSAVVSKITLPSLQANNSSDNVKHNNANTSTTVDMNSGQKDSNDSWDVDENSYNSILYQSSSSPRKKFDARNEDDVGNVSYDHDENKYQRRSAFTWLARWLKSRSKGSKLDPHHRCKKWFIVILISFLVFLTVILILQKLGRAAAENDPFLDPMANPNIRIEPPRLVDSAR